MAESRAGSTTRGRVVKWQETTRHGFSGPDREEEWANETGTENYRQIEIGRIWALRPGKYMNTCVLVKGL